VSSNDDLMAQALRDRQEAVEVAGLLREIEGKYGDPERRSDKLWELDRSLLHSCLQSARRLLGTHHVAGIIEALLMQIDTDEPIEFDLMQRYAALIARSLEDRYHLRAGGSPKGLDLSIGEISRSIDWKL
jgi:hypothetical protein